MIGFPLLPMIPLPLSLPAKQVFPKEECNRPQTARAVSRETVPLVKCEEEEMTNNLNDGGAVPPMVNLLALPEESTTNTIRPSPPPFKHEHYGPESTPECQQKLSDREESSPLSALSTYPNPSALRPPPHGTLSPIWAKGIAFSSICPGCIAKSPLFCEKRKWFWKYFPVFMKYITEGAMWCSAVRCGAVFGVDC